MSQLITVLLLTVMTTQDWPRAAVQQTNPNQRIQELQNRHDRRFHFNPNPSYSRRSRGR